MNTFHRITAAALLVLGIAGIPTTNTAGASATPAPIETSTEIGTMPAELPAKATIAPLTVVGADERQGEMLETAIAQFADAGLELPPLLVEFHDQAEPCRGNAGTYFAEADSPNSSVDRIAICDDMKIIILHELAHAWKHHNLDEATRTAFVEHWGLDGWRDLSDDWHDRGVERAAHTIAFALNQSSPTDNPNILRYVCGYELLTGATLPIHALVEC
ncbi:MAG: hypothetical protein ACR2P0_15565 [Acidimicrobiales bacterium]